MVTRGITIVVYNIELSFLIKICALTQDILVLSDIVLGIDNVGYIFLDNIQKRRTKDLEFWRR